MGKPSLEEVKEYFKNAETAKDWKKDKFILELENIKETDKGWVQNPHDKNWGVLWLEGKGYAKILTYKNTEPKFEITKEQILELYNTENPQPTIRKMFPEVFEVKLEIGKWYIVTNIKTGSLGFEGIGQYTKEKSESGLLETESGFNFIDVHGKIWRTNGDIRLATPEEVTEALKKEAIRMGYLKNINLVKCNSGFSDSSCQEYYSNKKPEIYFEYNCNKLWIQEASYLDICIFDNGKWAEIIPTKTIQQAEELLKELGHEIKIVS